MLCEPADIVIHVQGKGFVVKEKSLVAFQKSDAKIVAFGTEAYGMAEKNLEDIVVVSPLRQGFIADFTVAERLFRYLLLKAVGKKPILNSYPAVAVCVPKGITEVEKKAFWDAFMMAGAKEFFATELPIGDFLELRESSGERSKEYGKYKITIGIGKDELERYVKERMKEILDYAAQEQISQDRVYELLQSLKEDKEITKQI